MLLGKALDVYTSPDTAVPVDTPSSAPTDCCALAVLWRWGPLTAPAEVAGRLPYGMGVNSGTTRMISTERHMSSMTNDAPKRPAPPFR